MNISARLPLSVPPLIWAAAEKQARRSTLARFRTGAVIWDLRSGKILAWGCSHAHDGGPVIASIHAEHHALQNFHPERAGNEACLVVTLNRAGHHATTSRPCSSCYRLLAHNSVGYVIYRAGASVEVDEPALITTREVMQGSFAKHLRVQESLAA